MEREIWAYLEDREGGFHETAMKMVHEARRTARLMEGLPCGLLIENGIRIPEKIEKMKGLEKLYVIEGTGTASMEGRARIMGRVVRQRMPEILLFAATPVGNELGGRVAAGQSRGFISDCSDFEISDNTLLARKPVYGGKADALMGWRTDPPFFASISVTSLEDVPAGAGPTPEMFRMEENAPELRLRFKERWRVPLRELDLGEAGVVIGVGKGVPPGFMGEIHRLSEALGAAVGGTRIAVHTDLIPVERQIGTTGKWLHSDLYLALGISGAPQHLMGLKDVKKIVAVNIWKGASIFDRADLGVVGDLSEVVPELLALLKKQEK